MILSNDEREGEGEGGFFLRFRASTNFSVLTLCLTTLLTTYTFREAYQVTLHTLVIIVRYEKRKKILEISEKCIKLFLWS